MFARRVRLLGCFFAILSAAQLAWSQESRASVVGRVTDTTGAVIPAASVSFTNVDTGVTVLRADIDGYGRTNLGSGWGPQESFHAVAEDRGKPGAGNDRFGINKCDNPPTQPITKGEITIKIK